MPQGRRVLLRTPLTVHFRQPTGGYAGRKNPDFLSFHAISCHSPRVTPGLVLDVPKDFFAWIIDTPRGMLEAGYQMLDAGHWMIFYFAGTI